MCTLPAGVERRSPTPGGLSWTAQHGSVVATSYDITTSDGLNEAGLAGQLLWLAEADYGESDGSGPSRTPLPPSGEARWASSASVIR